MKTGVMIVNLGTPDSSEPEAVGRYLKQFLMDKWVINSPYFLRWFLVNLLVVPKRKYASAEAYHKVWTNRGSPLLFHSQDFVEKLQLKLGEEFKVKLAMRYGKPSIPSVMQKFKSEGFEDLIIYPMYPQYAESSVRSSMEELKTSLLRLDYQPRIKIVPPFHSSQSYIETYAEQIRPYLGTDTHLLLSYHGLPESHVQKTDPTKQHCLKDPNCCERLVDVNRFCYRAHCFSSSRLLAEKLELRADQYSVSFQSRLGREPWIKPYTDVLYVDLIKQGKTNLVVASPSFVTDCLETLEEISMRLREDFLREGGKKFEFVPCLNSSDKWVNAASDVVVRVAKS